MKKGSLNFLNRKSQSLFDTNVQIKEIDTLDLVLNSTTIPESGTAKVRARPTVKHVNVYGDSTLGFAVPTPKVPVLPPVSEPHSRHAGSTERLFNGGAIAVNDPEEGEIFIPPPPSVAPPPPPQYAPPPPEFYGELDPSVGLAGLQPPSMPAPKHPSLTGSVASGDQRLASLMPPPMAPPKPPSNSPNMKGSVPVNNNTNTAQNIPPLPPGEKPQFSLPKTQKTPPPKPVRAYSTSSLDLLPTGPAPPVPTPSPTPASSFNPQNTAKLYSVPKTSVLSSQEDPDKKAQHILFLEDSSGNPVGVHVNGKNLPSVKGSAQSPGPPAKPMRRNSTGLQLEQDLQVQREDFQETLPNQRPIQPAKPNIDEPSKVMTLQEIPTPVKSSPKTERLLSAQEVSPVKEQQLSLGRPRYSPLLNRKLQVLRGHESSGVKETAASPLALLQAAKERDKQRAGLSRQSSSHSSSSCESTNFSTQPSETRPNSFAVSSRPASSSSEYLSEEPKLAAPREPETKVQSAQFSPSKPTNPPSSSSLLCMTPIKQGEPTMSTSLPRQDKNHEEVMGIPFIPPPPEFANSDEENEGPPMKSVIPPVKSSPFTNGPATFPKPASSRNPAALNTSPSNDSIIKKPIQIKSKPQPAQPPSPPTAQPPAPPSIQPPPPPTTQPPAPPSAQPPAPPKTLPPTPPKTLPPTPPKTQPPTPPKAQPPPPPSVQPPAPPKLQPPALPKTQSPTPPKTRPTSLPPLQAAPSVSASQATLLSILQKKMLEMDPKFIPTREVDSSGEDWNSPLSDDDSASSSPIKSPLKTKTFPIQSKGLDMKELENKVAKKAQNTAAKAPASSQSKQQYGMTFTVRPGTQQPITPVPKGE